MPRLPKPSHTFSVMVHCYASPQIKADVETGRDFIHSPDQLQSISFYWGSDRRQAGIKFVQACEHAMVNPLVIAVVMHRDNDEIARVKPDR
jgi:hypothetical protein